MAKVGQVNLLMPFSAAEIAKIIGGEVAGDPATILKGFAPADRAQPGDLTFAENENYFGRAEQSAAEGLGLGRGAPVSVTSE